MVDQEGPDNRPEIILDSEIILTVSMLKRKHHGNPTENHGRADAVKDWRDIDQNEVCKKM